MNKPLLVMLCASSLVSAAASDYSRTYAPDPKPPAAKYRAPEVKKEAPKPAPAVKPVEVAKPVEAAKPAEPAKADDKAGHEAVAHHDVKSTVKELVAGNKHFQEGVVRQRDTLTTRHELAKGQHPNTIVLGCSDSRVPPELLFDESLGDLFVVRSAGNVADKIGLASIEYAAEHLHAGVVVVLGHEKCGAVTAAASGAKMPTENLQALMDEISPGLASLKAKYKGDELVHHGVEANVNATAYELVERSPIIRKLVEDGELRILKGIYDLDSGAVRWVGEDAETVGALCAEPDDAHAMMH